MTDGIGHLIRDKFSVGDVVKYRTPESWLQTWTEIPLRDGDTGVIVSIGSEPYGPKDDASRWIDLYGVQFFCHPSEVLHLSSPWLRRVT